MNSIFNALKVDPRTYWRRLNQRLRVGPKGCLEGVGRRSSVPDRVVQIRCTCPCRQDFPAPGSARAPTTRRERGRDGRSRCRATVVPTTIRSATGSSDVAARRSNRFYADGLPTVADVLR